MPDNYYTKKLNAAKLFQVYDTKIPRIDQYLQAEIDFTKDYIKSEDKILEIGCGYGRIIKELAPFAREITGIDISENSIKLGKDYLEQLGNVYLLVMDAHRIVLPSNTFDVVFCLQNGLSAMKGEPLSLIGSAARLLKPNGKALFSTYSPLFWEHRLAWFEEQADKKLLGEIDYDQTKNGVIVCKDGFTAKTFSEEDLAKLGEASCQRYEIKIVDNSSIFLVITKKPAMKSE